MTSSSVFIAGEGRHGVGSFNPWWSNIYGSSPVSETFISTKDQNLSLFYYTDDAYTQPSTSYEQFSMFLSNPFSNSIQEFNGFYASDSKTSSQPIPISAPSNMVKTARDARTPSPPYNSLAIPESNSYYGNWNDGQDDQSSSGSDDGDLKNDAVSKEILKKLKEKEKVNDRSIHCISSEEKLTCFKDGLYAAASFVQQSIHQIPTPLHWKVCVELADLAKRENTLNLARKFFKIATNVHPQAAQPWLEYAKVLNDSDVCLI
jgi:hypothetical protein